MEFKLSFRYDSASPLGEFLLIWTHLGPRCNRDLQAKVRAGYMEALMSSNRHLHSIPQPWVSFTKALKRSLIMISLTH